MASMTLSPTTVGAGTNQPVNIVATGTGTNWTPSTQFEVFGGNTASIGDVLVNATNQTAQIQLYPGGASGTLTITEVTNNTSATVSAVSTAEVISGAMVSTGVINGIVEVGKPAELRVVAPPGTYTVTSSVGDTIPNVVVRQNMISAVVRWTPTASGTLTFSGGLPACSYQVQGLGFHPTNK